MTPVGSRAIQGRPHLCTRVTTVVGVAPRSPSHPALGLALRKVSDFVRAHPNWNEIDSRLLSKSLREIDTWDLARAILILIDAGALRQLYRVTTPSGTLSDALFETPSDVPAKLPDRFNEYFDTAEQDLVPVLVANKR